MTPTINSGGVLANNLVQGFSVARSIVKGAFLQFTQLLNTNNRKVDDLQQISNNSEVNRFQSHIDLKCKDPMEIMIGRSYIILLTHIDNYKSEVEDLERVF